MDRHEEDSNKSKSSQPAQAKAAESQNPPPLPPPDTAPTTASSASAQEAQAVPARQAPAQPVQRQAAQAVSAIIQTAPAIGATPVQLPMAKAVPLQQSQGHVQVAAQPDPKAMPARHTQGQREPLYPPQQQLIAVQPRPQAQQFAAPPGLGTTQQPYPSSTYPTT